MGVRGEYRMVARKKGKVVRDTGWFPNLITNQGMDDLGNGVNTFNAVCVGEGSTPPANTDTTLVTYHQSQTSAFSNSVTNGGSPDYENRLHKTWRFPVQAVNKNYAEVGVGPNGSGTNLASRALIVDVGGTPTTFTVLVGEQLEVTYRLWIYPKVSDSTSNVTISGTNYTFTYRGRSVNSVGNLDNTFGFTFGWNNAYGYGRCTNGTISANTGSGPSGTGDSPDSYTVAAYTNGNYYRDVTHRYSTSVGNLAGGITAFEVYFCSTGGGFLLPIQIGVSPAIPKDNTKVLTLVVRYSWVRI